MAEFIVQTDAEVFAQLYASYLAAPAGKYQTTVADNLRAFVGVTANAVAVDAGYRQDCVVRVRLKPVDTKGIQHLELGVSSKLDTETGWENRLELLVALYPGIPGQITIRKYRVGSDPQMNRRNTSAFINKLAEALNWRWNSAWGLV